MTNTVNPTKVVTGLARLSYANIWQAKSINGGAPKFSTSVLIPKSDKETIKAIEAAVDAAIEEGIAKFGGKKPNKAAIKLPLRDGDIERDEKLEKVVWDDRYNLEKETEYGKNVYDTSRISVYLKEMYEKDSVVSAKLKKYLV